jgi:hypothetical protein
MKEETTMDPIGKYDAWITLSGLRLTTKKGISPVRQIELTPGEALALLQALYGKRDILLRAACPALRDWLYHCPHCQTPCPLEITPTGYEGSCANCGDVFRLTFSAHLLDHDYASYSSETKENERR